jgi:hypothetical protein
MGSTRSGGGVDGAGFFSGFGLAIGSAGSLIFAPVVPS